MHDEIETVNARIEDIIYQLKLQAVKHENYALVVAHGVIKRKVPEVLSTVKKNKHRCPSCGKQLKAQ